MNQNSAAYWITNLTVQYDTQTKGGRGVLAVENVARGLRMWFMRMTLRGRWSARFSLYKYEGA